MLSRYGRRHRQSSSGLGDNGCCVCACASSVLAWIVAGFLYVHVYVFNGDDSGPAGMPPSGGPLGNALSMEFDPKNLWKPIYVENLGIRMPYEEMDAILEKYWIPRAQKQYPQLYQINDNTPQPPSPDIEAQQVNNANNQQKSNSNPNSNSNSVLKRLFPHMRDITLTYPADWINEQPCQSDPFNSNCVVNHLQYWQRGTSVVSEPAKIRNKYVTFLKDCGGFNNIRQGFEFHAMVAWITNRTLVLPPDEPWYLIDRGQITRGKPSDAKMGEILGSLQDNRHQGVSNYDIFFEISDMRLKIAVITTPEFIKKEMHTLNIPSELSGNVVNTDDKKRREYLQWLNSKASQLGVELPWGQLSNLLVWPNKGTFTENRAKYSNVIDDAFIDNRKLVEYTSYLANQPFIHFPSCAHSGGSQSSQYRYLGQIARSVAFVGDNRDNLDLSYKQVLRDHIHLTSDIFVKYAAKVIEILGLFQYTALHVRRNELQYKYVFCSAEESYNNIKPLINEYEVIYIASDESDPNYFKIFEDGGKHIVLQWKHFFGKDAIFEETKDLYVPPKYHGPMEMIICGAARMFFGTKESTFSSYISRLRGYLNAPYTQTLYHHYKLTSDVDRSSDISKSNPGKPYRGQIYKIEFPDLWEDIKHLP